MPHLEDSLRSARSGGRKLLLPYVTGGIRPDWLDIVREYEAAGADAVEIGIPFSDPVMDGPTIQAASDMALRAGATPRSILAELRTLDVPIPLIAMTYANVAYRMGFDRFVTECVDSGISGAIVPDIPMGELDDWEAAVGEKPLETVLLASPITPTERLAQLADRSQGFVYGVNVLGVTGERSDVGLWTNDLATRLKSVTDLPVVMGFGISSAATAVAASQVADGVVIASALMRMVVDGKPTSDVGKALAEVRAALDSAYIPGPAV